MIQNGEMIDLSKNSDLFSNIYYITSSSIGCNFDLKSNQPIKEQKQNIDVKFIDKDNNNIIIAKCILSKQNNDKIPCTLNKEINNDFILDSYIGSSENGFYALDSDDKSFQLKCQYRKNNKINNNNKNKAIYIIIVIISVILVSMIILIICYIYRKKAKSPDSSINKINQTFSDSHVNIGENV